ncbi:MAG: trypsin-like peptidase domain-containing protein [Ekhidna sp.]|nr:trypsin-like peptidase domain-containing protein [Ekhidna sp.]
MNQIKNLLFGIAGGLVGAFLYVHLFDSQPVEDESTFTAYTEERINPSTQMAAANISLSSLPNEDFKKASESSTPSVVFIQTLSEVEYRTGGWMNWFFEPRSSQRIGSGSGVVFSTDGHIVTNNHVIQDADKITVIAGKRSFQAELVGRDPSSDLAVIKIDSDELPAIKKGDSEKVAVGEWVLAVGNPFNLTSTVTAGIVSAKGRNINILKDKFPIESFIQTDAAINPGNSGGALVNAGGELIGINTAILSRTGSYAGYGFAIPVNIVKKVFNDLVKYGEVQKAFIGLDFIDIDSELAARLAIENLDGVIVADVKYGSASDKAGIKKQDVIREINGIRIRSKSQVEEIVAKSYPGDLLELVLERDDEIINKKVTLTNREGTTTLITRDIYYAKKLDARFESVSKVERDLLGIKNGVKVVEFENGGFFSVFNIPEGFIITQINNRTIESPAELEKILTSIRGRFDIIGINERGRRVYYPFRR